MTIYWVNVDTQDALTLMVAVERALETGDTGTPPPPGVAASPAASVNPTDTYLHDNMAIARAVWSVDPHRIVLSSRPGLAAAINAFQRLVRRATWWYALPQWLQISEFHGAVVRTLDALIEKERRLDMRVRDIEQMRLQAHLFTLQQQIAVLRARNVLNWRAASPRWKRNAHPLSTPNKPARRSSTDTIRIRTLVVI